MEKKEIRKKNLEKKRKRKKVNRKKILEERKKRENEIKEQNISKIRKSIIEWATKTNRIQIYEINEMIGINNPHLIINTIKQMIKNEEIQAQYFSSTKSIVFEQKSSIQDLSKSGEDSSPIIIPDEKKICIVCKGLIKHLFYECPDCKVKYHLKCAILLKDDDKTCFNCGQPFPILPDLPETIEISDDKKGEPIVVLLQNISNELAGFLIPGEIKQKDFTTKFNQLKKNLQDELRHKTTIHFFEEFRVEIEELFIQISNIDIEDIPALENLKNNQRQIFYDIIERLKKLEGHCNNCGNRITDLNQTKCEYCGETLN